MRTSLTRRCVARGRFIDSRLDNAKQYPVAAKARWGRKRDATDLVTAKLPALHFYQLVMPTPKAPAGSYDGDSDELDRYKDGFGPFACIESD